MPYRRDGKCVYKGDELIKCHGSVDEAKKHLTALNINVKESALTELSMFVHKATREKKSGVMRLSMVNSDTGEDVYGERMSLELFDDFVYRSDNGLSVPEPFDKVVHEEKWQGGAPYLSIAHYKSSAFDEFPGEQEKLYRDGEKLKSVDILYDNPLGRAVWKSVYNDLYEEEKTHEDPVRVSIGFIDLAHKHELEDGEIYFERKSLEDKCEACAEGVGGKVYLKGHLVHKAFTRVPVHPRTDVEIEMKSAIETKKQDAESIIGEEFEINEKSSIRDDVMVVKAEDSRDLEQLEDKMDEKYTQEEVVEEVATEPVEEVVEEPKEDVVVVEESVIEEKSVFVIKAEEIGAKVKELTEKGLYGDEALQQIQPLYNDFGETLKSELAPKGEAAAIQSAMKSAIAEAIAGLKGDIVAEVVKELSGAIQQPVQQKAQDVSIPAPRSLTVAKAKIAPEGQKQLSQIERIAQKSVGL